MRILMKMLRLLWLRGDDASAHIDPSTSKQVAGAADAAVIAVDPLKVGPPVAVPIETIAAETPTETSTETGAAMELVAPMTATAPVSKISRRPLALRLAGAARANRTMRSAKKRARRTTTGTTPRPVVVSARKAKRTPDLYPMKRRPAMARKPALKVLVERPKVRPSAMIIPMPVVARQSVTKPNASAAKSVAMKLKKAA